MNILEKIPFQSNQAVVFDIDDTLISSRTHRSIPNVCELYNKCLNKGYAIYIITARPGTPYAMNFTVQQLRQCDIKGYKKIYFRPPYDLNVPLYKKNARKKVLDQITF